MPRATKVKMGSQHAAHVPVTVLAAEALNIATLTSQLAAMALTNAALGVRCAFFSASDAAKGAYGASCKSEK